MSDDPKILTVSKTVRHHASDTPHASFIYFDAVPASGYEDGLVSATLTANCMLPSEDAKSLHAYPVVVGYLRCSRTAAKILRDALDGALLMASVPDGSAN